MRIAITGGVNTGKSLLAAELAALVGAAAVRPTDALLPPHPSRGAPPGHESWTAINEEVARWMREPGPWVISGVRVPHALLLLPPDSPLPDLVVYLTRALSREDRAQGYMTRSVDQAMLKARALHRRLPCWRGPYSPTLAAELAAHLEIPHASPIA